LGETPSVGPSTMVDAKARNLPGGATMWLCEHANR
jgi:hypothetical protein